MFMKHKIETMETELQGYKIRAYIIYDIDEISPISVATTIEQEDHIRIHYIHTQRRFRGQGLGTAILREIVKRAQQINKPIKLIAFHSLVDWYKKNGFQIDENNQSNYLIKMIKKVGE